MSTSTEDFLAHHGVLGMKWGVRHDKGHEGQSAKTKTIVKLDKKFGKRADSRITKYRIHEKAALLFNNVDVERIEEKPEYKGQNFRKDTPLRQKYRSEFRTAFAKRLNEVAKDFGTNASGTKQYQISELSDNNWKVTLADVKHADDNSLIVDVTYDSMGHITKIVPRETEILHSVETPEDFLAHYGVLGMKWGKHLPGKGLRTTAAPHEDHTKTREILKRPVQSSSNQELQAANKRLNLEKNFSDLKKRTTAVSRGQKAVKSILALGAASAAIAGFFNTPLGKATIKAGKVAVDNMLGGSGKHSVNYIAPVVKTVGRHL